MSAFRMTLDEIAAALGVAAPAQGEVVAEGLSTDTRTLRPGALFVALQGPNFDAHTLLGEARRKGAVAALVARPVDDPLPRIEVADTRAALGRLGAAWRDRFEGPLVAITGSNGKTTVKEMVAAILAGRGEVVATRGNLNNEIGVPLTLLTIDPARHNFAVVEMGANHAGEIACLSGLVRPDVALVNNAAAAHLAGFGSIEGVARAKAEIWQGLGPEGVAVVNADDPHAPLWESLLQGRRVVRFGREGDVRLAGTPRVALEGGRFVNRFTLATPAGEIEVELHLAGAHNVANAMAATATALAAGATADDVARGLASMKPVAGRLQPRVTAWGQLLIDDSYNANPDSLAAAIEVLAALPGERALVLGEMAELGDEARARHRQAGERARAAGIEHLFACGPLCREAVAGFGEGGRWFATRDELTAHLADWLAGAGEEVSLLLKGSRSAALNEVADALVAGAGEEAPAGARAEGA